MKNNLTGNNFIKVTVVPNSASEKVKKEKSRFIIEVRQKAENGAANRRVFQILSLIFPEKRIELVKGGKEKNKIFKINEK